MFLENWTKVESYYQKKFQEPLNEPILRKKLRDRRHTDRWTNRQTDRQTDSWTNRQTGRQTEGINGFKGECLYRKYWRPIHIYAGSLKSNEVYKPKQTRDK